MANEIQPIKSYAHFYNESTWATKPGSPSYVFCPVLNYGVQLRRESRNAATFTGLRQRKHGQHFRDTLSGGVTVPLYGWRPSGLAMSLAEYFLVWAFGSGGSTDAVMLASKGVEWAEGPDVANQRHHGLRINSATLSGSADSGFVQLALDLIGKNDEAVTTAQTIPNDMEKCVEFEWADCAFEIGGSAVELRSFQLQIQNGLRGEFVGGRSISLLPASQRVVSLQMELVKSANTWDVYRRTAADTETNAELTLKGLHNGTGTAETSYAVSTITLPRIRYGMHEDQRGRDGLSFLPLQFDVLKPDSSSNDVAIVMSEE